MCEKYDIDDKTRFLVLYFDARFGILDIAKIIDRSPQIVRNWETRTKNGENIRLKKKKTGRKVIPEETINTVIQLIKENPEGTSTTKLGARLGISRNLIAKILKDKGYKYKAIDHTILYSEEERTMRMDFCKRMLSDDGKTIYRAFFSDEMGVNYNNLHKRRAWQTPTEKIKRKSVTENIKLNCWGAISAQGATSLDIYEKGMNGDLYRQVIQRHKVEMETLYAYGEFYFVQDNHPAHKVSEDWMVKDQRFQLIKLPKRSPDLNIIENLWSALKERVASDAPANERELRASLLRNWEVLTQPDRLQPYFEGLHRRYMECVTKEGHKLPY